MNKQLTEEEKNMYGELGKSETRSEVMMELNTATKNMRHAAFKDAQMRA